jgi:hypothetical protein
VSGRTKQQEHLDLTDEQIGAIRRVAEPLFAEAVAQGMHSPFALNCESWGRTWGEKLAYELTRSAVVEPETPD